MKKTSRILSLLLIVCIMITLAPMSVFAAEDEKAIQLAVKAIKDPTEKTFNNGKYYTPNSYLYFGANGTSPLLWRVLDAEKTNADTSGMFILSERVLENAVDFEAAYNYDDNDGQTAENEWQHSDAQAWCKAAVDVYFTEKEKGVLLGVTKIDPEFGIGSGPFWLPWASGSQLTTEDKLFFLSAMEVEAKLFSNTSVHALGVASDLTGKATTWWLRSPNFAGYQRKSRAGYVMDSGLVTVTSYNLNEKHGARPATNIDSKAVLMTSAAVSGKISPAQDGTLTKVADTQTNVWKLTVLDKNRKFAIKEETVKAVAGDTVELTYTGATLNTANTPNEYISAILADGEGNILFYGRLMKSTAENGKVKIVLPKEMENGSYTLYLYSEQHNGDKMTDLGSELDPIALDVVDKIVSESPVPEIPDPEVPQTGDPAQLALWMALCMAGAMAFFMINAKKRKAE